MKKYTPSLIAVFSFLSSFNALAQPEIHFTDYRVFLDAKNNKVDYEIFNQGTSNAACSTGIVDYQVDENGKLSLVKKGEPKPDTSATELIKISPRNVNINSLSSQKLKVFAKRVRSQDDGEWVSYLELECRNADIKLSAGININPTFKYHIPVVVRKGKFNTSLNFIDTQVIAENSNYFLSTKISREGNRSTFGKVTITDLEGNIIGRQTGISQYTQTKILPLKISLNKKPEDEVIVTYTENKKYGGDITKSITVKVN